MSDAAECVYDVTEAEFKPGVVDASFQRPVVVDFWAPWCAPCRQLGPVLERLVRERKGAVAMAKVNVDECQRVAQYFGIEAIPAVKAFRDGQLMLEFDGVLPEAQLRAFLDKLGGAAVEEGIEPESPAELEMKFRKQIEADKDNHKARIGLAKALLAQNKTTEILDILDPIPAEGDAAVEAAGIKSRLELSQLAKDRRTNRLSGNASPPMRRTRNSTTNWAVSSPQRGSIPMRSKNYTPPPSSISSWRTARCARRWSRSSTPSGPITRCRMSIARSWRGCFTKTLFETASRAP